MLVLNILLDKNRCYIICVEFQVKDSLHSHSFIWIINESKLNKEGREFHMIFTGMPDPVNDKHLFEIVTTFQSQRHRI